MQWLEAAIGVSENLRSRVLPSPPDQSNKDRVLANSPANAMA
jgi:hypothetical protein